MTTVSVVVVVVVVVRCCCDICRVIDGPWTIDKWPWPSCLNFHDVTESPKLSYTRREEFPAAEVLASM